MKASDLKRNPVEEAIKEHIAQGVPFSECMFRPGSEAFTEFYTRVREMRESLDLDWQDQELLDTDIGECIMIEGERVPLDVPIEDLPEGRMPASVIKSKQRNAEMSDEEFASKFKDASDDDLRSMAWRHGYGKGSNYYVNKKKRGLNEEVELDEASTDTLFRSDPREKTRPRNRKYYKGTTPIGSAPGYDLTAFDSPSGSYIDPDDPDKTKYTSSGDSISPNVQVQLRKSISLNGEKDVKFANGQQVKVSKNIARFVLQKINSLRTSQEKFKVVKYIDQSYKNLLNFAMNGVTEDIKEAEYQGRKVKLNSPKRGGPKKFYVYVKNPKTGRVKKISWGDTSGLSVKAKDRGAVRSFVARHKCKQKNDKMKAGYWACRTPRYKALGVKGGAWW